MIPNSNVFHFLQVALMLYFTSQSLSWKWFNIHSIMRRRFSSFAYHPTFSNERSPIVPNLKNVPFKMKDVIPSSNIEEIRFRHIQLESEELAKECKKMWECGELDFEYMAQTLSTCKWTSSKGGDSGWVSLANPLSFCPIELLNECCHMAKGDLMDIFMKLNVKDLHRKKDCFHKKSRNERKTYTIDTMGCQMNVADSERMEAQLAAIGYAHTIQSSNANLVIVNTCSIRDHAEQKVYAHLVPHFNRKKSGEDVTIVVAGCVAQQEGENLIKRFPEIDLVMGPQYSNRIVDLLESVLDGHQLVATDPAYQTEDKLVALRRSDIAAYVNVIYGCNEHCTYCVVPATRGIEQSRTKEAIVKEIEALVKEGYQEITLLGQNIDAWGRDMTPKQKFADLLEHVALVKNLKRLRFLTSHPKYMSKNVIGAVAKHANIMPCFYVPFQSGDNHILKMMRRGYSRERFISIINNIRDTIPDASIIADAIVGFPGETDEQFQHSLALMEEVKFDLVNTAAYSPRPGTPASTWENQIRDEIKQDRLMKMRNLMMNHALERSERFIGTVQDVLVDDIDPKHSNFVSGRNPQNRIVFFEGSFKKLRGQIVQVLITEARPFSLTGRSVLIPEKNADNY